MVYEIERFYYVKRKLAVVIDLDLKHFIIQSHKLKLRAVITHYYD